MSSIHSQRGAVSIMWVIFLMVIAIAFGALWFAQLQSSEDVTERARITEERMRTMQAKFVFARTAYEIVAKQASQGYPKQCPVPGDDSIHTKTADEVLGAYVKKHKNELEDLKTVIDEPGVQPTTLRDAWDALKNKIATQKTELQNKDLEIGRLKTEVSEKEAERDQIQTAKASDRTKADETHAAEVDNLKNTVADLRGQNSSFSDRNRTLTEEVSQAKDKATRDVQNAIADKQALEHNVKAMKSQLRIARTTEKPDGNVVRGDPVRGIVYIDIGSKTMLRAGTRFKVYETGKGGLKIHKGYIRVTSVDIDRAECRVDERVAGVGDIGAGDWIYNPYFSPNKSHRFVFLGEMPGSWDRSTVSQLLKQRGATIDPKVTTETDFVILGVQEDEDAAPLTDSADYRLAVQLGIEIIRGRDLAPYLKF